ncbi:MAG TPA: aminotransferase class I/II-fold pyridoxal phosphate-dependent enzyme [Bacteriovoracaceae bacterium]|nr:aminotransferase class I/II-fold pyridoxal phosphate-dependent enzyme [Bacteriovoracaceae bacterium]
MTKRSDWGEDTLLNHPRRVPLLPGNDPLVAPIHQSVKFQIAEEFSYQEQFIYSRVSNPTLRQLEETLAEFQQTQECMVLASGIAAISVTLLALLKSGDHVIAFREMYRPARIFIRDVLPGYGITASILKLGDSAELERSIIPGKTKLIHFESPTNPNLEIADIERIVAIARKNQILVSMDGTFAGIHQHRKSGIDLMIHSLTKFANGHGDVLGGSVAGEGKLIARIRNLAHLIGASLDPHAAFLIMRGLKTYKLRYEKQSRTAQEVATFLQTHSRVQQVYYPGLGDHKGHELAQKQMKDMGGVVSFTLEHSRALKAKNFCHRLQLIQFSISLGSTESVICPTAEFFGDDLDPQERRETGIDEYSLRLSVGLEDSRDLLEDLRAALEGE